MHKPCLAMVTQAVTQRARCFDPQEVHAQLGFVSAEGGSEASARSDLARKDDVPNSVAGLMQWT